MLAKVLTTAALLAAASACSSAAAVPAPAPTVPPGASEQVVLQAQITQQLSGQGMTVTNVQCPADVTAVEATTAACTGVVAGQTLNISVTFAADSQIIVSVAP